MASGQTHDPAKLLREHRDRIRAQIREIQKVTGDLAYVQTGKRALTGCIDSVRLHELGVKLMQVVRE